MWPGGALVTEVAPANRFVLLQLRARARQGDASDLEHVRGLRELQRDVRVLLDDEHRQALLLVQLADDAEDLRDEQRRETERRLVEEQQPRTLHERAREREHLLLAAAERAGLLVAALLEPGEIAEHARDVVLRRAAPCVRAEAEVLPHRQLR